LPELPEVETVRRGLEQKLNNFIVHKVEILRNSSVALPRNKCDFIMGINNSLIDKWERRGKYLIAYLKKNNQYKEFKNNGFLIVHLRMTGFFKWIKNHEKEEPCKHTRVRFFDKDENELRFIDLRAFGQLWWIKDGQRPEDLIKGLGSLGPEPFSNYFNYEYLKKELSKRTKSIKAVLLDQTIIAGIGNIYADESLFEAGILPYREAKTLNEDELNRLHKSIISVLKKSIGSGGTTFSDFRNIEGTNGNYSMSAKVYRRNGKECNVCANIINKKKLGGRSTHWCSVCQK